MIDLLDFLLAAMIIASPIILICSYLGYKAGLRKMAKEVKDSDLPFGKPYCNQCGAMMPDHYHGCPIAADFRLATRTKLGG